MNEKTIDYTERPLWSVVGENGEKGFVVTKKSFLHDMTFSFLTPIALFCLFLMFPIQREMLSDAELHLNNYMPLFCTFCWSNYK